MEVSLQRTRAGVGTDGTYLSSHLLPVDAQGQPIACDAGSFEVTVEMSTDGQASWLPVDSGAITVACSGDGDGDLAVVLDNSGSTQSVLDLIQDGSADLIDDVLASGGRGSLVRVSTNAEVLSDITDDVTLLDVGLARIGGSNGWTALWDGVRMGNETLGGEVVSRAAAQVWDSADAFCEASDSLGILAFTDGHENNSADQNDYDHVAYPGDGYDTTLDDLKELHVNGQTTPVYTIGLGSDPDHEALGELAEATGGIHHAVVTPGDVLDTFSLVGDYLDSTHQVCATLDESVCGLVHLRVSWSYAAEGDLEPQSIGEAIQSVSVDCPTDPVGTSAVILMTMTNPHLPEADAVLLSTNAVAYVSPVEAPSVLVVLDDNHHDEFAGDPDAVAGWLEDAGLPVVRLDEPADGITGDDLVGHDVVWFSNPGYPPDDLGSIEALEAFMADGGGVVLQGDDMTRGWGNAFSMTALTSLVFEHNGTQTCGVATDDNEGELFEVTTVDGHPMLDGLENTTWLYGDDIDQSTAAGVGERILAEATLAIDPGCTTTPTIVAFDP